MTRLVTKCLDRIAWEIWYRVPQQWERVGRRGVRAWIARSTALRAREAINTRRFIP
jgi:hypothetical protein